LRRVDHIAIVVDNTVDAANWYAENYEANIEYCDDSWSLVSFLNIKLAFILPGEHPPHFAFEVKELDGGNTHRDGSRSIYKTDPWGNSFELVVYPKVEK